MDSPDGYFEDLFFVTFTAFNWDAQILFRPALVVIFFRGAAWLQGIRVNIWIAPSTAVVRPLLSSACLLQLG